MSFGLALALPTRPRGDLLAAAIRALFANNEQGAWYDPSDLSTLYQDAAGTTPVTAVEQPVGFMADKRLGLVRGAELATTAATAAGAWTYLNGVISATGSSGSDNVQINLSSPTVAGRSYVVTFTNTMPSSAFYVDFGSLGGTQVGNLSSTVSQAILTPTTSTSVVRFGRWSGGPSGTISNISVKALPGNHAIQSTAAARPVVKGAPYRVDYDTVDDKLTTTFASSLGSACTVARAIPGVGASISTAQTIGTTFDDAVDNCALILLDRAFTAAELPTVTAYLNAAAGV